MHETQSEFQFINNKVEIEGKADIITENMVYKAIDKCEK